LLRALLILVYWPIQGTLFTAIFVIGHDCGHGSFSDHPVLNDVIGTVWHGFLLCPYYMWKLSHKWHHKYNANIDKDEVFYPVRESEPTASGKTLPGFGFGIGWFGYLALGYNPRPVLHFNPFDKMFIGHVFGCFCSLFSLATMTYLLYHFYMLVGLAPFVIYYAVPLFIFACYIVVITFLHHTEMNIPWFADDQWDFVRGQLSTIDRHYGIVHDVIHCIGTHQMHHMFSKIPHYRLELATSHFRAAFPHLVRVCDEPILHSFVRMYMKYEKQCVVADDTKIHYYK
jgi:omega-3 fatty acid desaturase (delta-15 desaturase)